jgi:hypothetical protein
MINIFSPGLALVLAGWVVAVSGWRVGGGRVCRANWRVADLPTLPNPARNTILAMSPLGSSLPISSSQSQIGAMEVRIEGVQAQIAEVAEAVKAVQSQLVDVAAKIEKTEAALDAADLSSEKKVVLVMKLKSLMDKEAKLMDEKAILNDRLNILFGKDRPPGPGLVWNAERVTLGPAVDWGSLKIGDVVAVPLAHSGLSDNKPVQQLYVRRACLELSKFLRDLSTNVQLVTGCPGVGKSIEVFSFAFEQAQLHHKRVLYVHGDTKSGISVIFKDEPTIATARLARQTFSLEPEALNLFVDSVLREGLVDLVPNKLLFRQRIDTHRRTKHFPTPANLHRDRQLVGQRVHGLIWLHHLRIGVKEGGLGKLKREIGACVCMVYHPCGEVVDLLLSAKRLDIIGNTDQRDTRRRNPIQQHINCAQTKQKRA